MIELKKYRISLTECLWGVLYIVIAWTLYILFGVVIGNTMDLFNAREPSSILIFYISLFIEMDLVSFFSAFLALTITQYFTSEVTYYVASIYVVFMALVSFAFFSFTFWDSYWFGKYYKTEIILAISRYIFMLVGNYMAIIFYKRLSLKP